MERTGILADRGREQRLATVLNCDLVDSTRTRMSLDPEGQLAFKHAFAQTVTRLAARYGGHVDALEGDGASIIFGFPLSQENAAELAVSLGFELVYTFRHTEILPDVHLPIRVGIASGVIGVEKQEPGFAAGLPFAKAERLQATADRSGQVVIDDATKESAGKFFNYIDLGVVEAKGFDNGIKAWAVVSANPATSRFDARRLDAPSGKIVGRDDVIGQLSRAWDRAAAGECETICLRGEAGIGKSRLARVSMEIAARSGAHLVEIGCTPSTGNTPLYPLGAFFCQMAKIEPAVPEVTKHARAKAWLEGYLSREEADEALRYLSPLFGLPTGTLTVNIGPDELHDKTIATIGRILTRLSGGRPMALLCEDLHWADAMTTKVLACIRKESRHQPVLLILTTRDTANTLPVELNIESVIDLNRLDFAAAAELIRLVANDMQLSEHVVNSIVNRCERVPLLLEEVTRNTLETAARAGEAAAVGELDGHVPVSLQHVVQARLGRWEQYGAIAEAASVLGRDFSLHALEKMVNGFTRSGVATAVQTLSSEGVFVEPDHTREDRGEFKHIMICEAVYNRLLRSDREALHSRAADVLRGEGIGVPDAAPEVIADHLSKAARFRESITVRYTASGDAIARGAYVEAGGHCLAALGLVDWLNAPAERANEALKLLMRLGVAQAAEHGYSNPTVEATYQRAEALCGGNVDYAYQVVRGLATFNLVRGNLAIAYDQSLRGLELAKQSRRADYLIDAMSLLSYTTMYFGRLDKSLEWIEACLQLYNAEGGQRFTYPVPQDAATAVLAILPVVTWLLGDAKASEEAIVDGIRHVDERLNRDFDKAFMHTFIAGTRYRQRRYGQAHHHAEIAVNISVQHSFREWRDTGRLQLHLIDSVQVADPSAVNSASEMCLKFKDLGVGLNAPFYLWALARGHAKSGNTPFAHFMIVEAFRQAEISQEKYMLSELLVLQAELDRDEASASQKRERAVTLAEEQGDVASALRAAIAITLRADGTDEMRDYARSTLEMLDGQREYPAERSWMKTRLRTLRPRSGSQGPGAVP